MKRHLFYVLMFATLALVGCQETSDNLGESIPLEQFSSLQSIKDYLTTNVASTGFGGKPYCAYEVLDAQQESENLNIYLWTVCQEYYSDKQKLRQGTSAVLPVALVMQRNGNSLSVLSHRIPRDGALYAKDMPVIFSKRFMTKDQAETTADRNNRVNRLQGEIEREAGVS
jgi:hypothetical protein